MSKNDALEAAVVVAVDNATVDVAVNGNIVTLTKGDSFETIEVSPTYNKTIHVTQATFKDYKSGEVIIGQTIVLGIDKTKSISSLPADTTISVFAADTANVNKLGRGLGKNTLRAEMDITRGDTTEAWGLSTTLLYSGSAQGIFAWNSTVWSAFTQDKLTPAFVKVEYAKDGETFSHTAKLTARP